MISLKILELNRFMAGLLKSDAFDTLWLREGYVRTYMEYRFQGRLYPEFYDTEEAEALQGRSCALWREVRPVVLELVKGRRTPLAFRLEFQLPEEEVGKVLERSGLVLREEPPSMHLQLRFEHGTGRIVTGIARTAFSMDSSPDAAWDAEVQRRLRELAIAVERES